MVTSFQYLGRVISAAYDEWPEVVRNLFRVREVWKSMTRILSRDGTELRVYGFFCTTVLQVVLLFGTETWVVTPSMGRVLGRFQYQVERQPIGMLPWWKSDGK